MPFPNHYIYENGSIPSPDGAMKVLFLYGVPSPKATVINRLHYNQGVGLLIALMKQKGHSVRLRQMWRLEPQTIDAEVQTLKKPDIVLISSTTDQYPVAKAAIEYCHRKHGLRSVLGGVHATMTPESCLDQEGLLTLCSGEGEGMLMDVLDAMESGRSLSGIANAWLRLPDGSIEQNKQRPFIENLDALPFPDRDAFDFQRILNQTYGAEVIAGRGCPYQCAFCVDPAYRQMNEGKVKYVRHRSLEHLFGELESLQKTYRNLHAFLFMDEIFTLNRKWLASFCEEYPKRFKTRIRVNARTDSVDDDALDMLKRAGCSQINYGIESGNDEMRNVILAKKVSRESIIEAFRKTKERGINALALNMVGLPMETEDMVKETIALNREVKPDIIFVSVFRPYPGTPLYDLCERNGWISDRLVQSYFECSSILDQPSLSRKKTAYYFNVFPWEIAYPAVVSLIRPLMMPFYKDHISIYSFIMPMMKQLYRFKVITWQWRLAKLPKVFLKIFSR
jgi:anaerobic magnesium-protoporphyrin IX monomethyl ester cyclase